METILKIEGLTKRFSGLTAVDNVSLEVRKREVHALIGPNGAGKTTTLNMVNGILPATEGTVTFYGADITKQPAYKIARMGMGRTYQNMKLFTSLTVLENLMVGGHYAHTKGGLLRFLGFPTESVRFERQLRDKAQEVLEFIGMSQYGGEVIGDLPYGRQKVAELGRALMSDPKLILLDEPAAGLNPTERKEFLEILQKVYDSDVDLFMIEHNMDVVMNISHRITVLNFGSKIAQGTPNEIQNNPEVIKAYLGDKYTAIQKNTEEGSRC